jgi:hypothetical protein
MSAELIACPPLFFAQRRDWRAFIVNGVLYAACLLCLTVAVIGGLARAVSWGAPTTYAVFFGTLCFAHVVDAQQRERAKILVRSRRNTKRLIRLAVFLASFVATLVLLRSIYTSTGQSVGEEIFPAFPVLVVSPENGGPGLRATIVFHEELAQFLQANPGSRYVVPEADEPRLRAGLSGGRFDVRRRADGTQMFEVRRQLQPEAFVVGWYEASETELVPRRFVVFHEMMMGFFGIPAMLAGLLLAWLVGKLLDAKTR